MKRTLRKCLKWLQVFYRAVEATLALGLPDAMEYAVVAGWLEGNRETAIANKGNPAGQAILARFFSGGIAPLGHCGRWNPLQPWVKSFPCAQ
jgi:hypothetical protein